MSQPADAQGASRRSDPVSVILVNDSASITGGADRVAITEAAGLAARGHRVTLIAGHGEPDRQLLEAGVSVRCTAQPTTLDDPRRARAGLRGIWNRRAAALVDEVTDGADPSGTIIHLHGFVKLLSASVARAAVTSGLPVVATLHDYFAACPNGGFFNYQTNSVCHLAPLSGRCVATHCDSRSYPHKLWRVARSTVQRSYAGMPSRIGHLITPSRFAAEIVHPFVSPSAALHVLPNPVPGPQLPPVDASDTAGFIFVGRLQHDKGPVILAEAARKARVPVVFVGTGHEADAVRRANPEAELTGWLEPPHVQARIRTARALVSPSLWYETQGLAALEAAAHGVPAVVPDHSAISEIVDDGRTGLWFRGGDADDLADKLSRLQRDVVLTQALGSGAYTRFWGGHWDLSSHLDRLEAIYRSAMAT